MLKLFRTEDAEMLKAKKLPALPFVPTNTGGGVQERDERSEHVGEGATEDVELVEYEEVEMGDGDKVDTGDVGNRTEGIRETSGG